MINVTIYKKVNDRKVAEFTLTDRLSIVVGDSATGKTHISNMLSQNTRSPYTYVAGNKNNKYTTKVMKCNSVEYFEECLDNTDLDGSVLVLDEYEVGVLSTHLGVINKAKHSRKYCLFLSRDGLIKHDVGVNSVFVVKRTNEVYSLERFFESKPLTLYDLKGIDTLVTEDVKS